MFNYKKYIDKDISSILGKCISPLKPEKIHGSRDYYQINKRYEIIPVLEIKNAKEAVNVTDASTLHVDWVNRRIKNKQYLKDEIRLAKLFLKAAGLYGAESYIKAISGHVTDILVIYYGSFEKMIRAIAKWKESKEIDIEKHKGILDKSKVQGPLIVIDPIQPNRNAAAAVNHKKYDLLKQNAKEFLKSPSEIFFAQQDISIASLKKEYNLVLKVNPKKGKHDVVGAKLMKGYEFMLESLAEFIVLDSGWFWDKGQNCYYFFNLKRKKLPLYQEKKGPSKEHPIHVARFKKIYSSTYIKKGIIYAKVKRSITKIEEHIKSISKNNYLKQKTGGIKIV
jgi:tRNA nucleotidyltransferase (CCA-adding enzyme)